MKEILNGLKMPRLVTKEHGTFGKIRSKHPK